MRRSVVSTLAFVSCAFGQNSSYGSPGGGNNDVQISWVGDAPTAHKGVTFGAPWPKGEYPADGTAFELLDSSGGSVEAASWITGWWPDDSVKWTAHAVAPSENVAESYSIRTGSNGGSSGASGSITVDESEDGIHIDTGALSVAFHSKLEKPGHRICLTD